MKEVTETLRLGKTTSWKNKVKKLQWHGIVINGISKSFLVNVFFQK